MSRAHERELFAINTENRNREILSTNIAKTIKAWKKDGTTGASLGCLKQNVPTTGLTCAPAFYHNVFEDVAKEVAKRLKFNVYV